MSAVSENEVYEEGGGELVDWQLPLAFKEKRHEEKIEGCQTLTQAWRMKERVRLDYEFMVFFI